MTQTSDDSNLGQKAAPRTDMWAALFFGVLLQLFGGIVAAAASSGREDVWVVIGWAILGLGSILTAIGAISFGVLLALRQRAFEEKGDPVQ